MPPSGKRAAPLPPEQRRAGIIAVTIPLLTAHGTDVTTKQIAAAAGIAEGTLFRVFPDKAALVQAAVQSAFDPSDLLGTLDTIDPSLPLEGRLKIAVEALVARLERVWSLMHMLRMTAPPDSHHGPPRLGPQQADMTLTMAAIEKVIAADAHRLRFPVEVAARMLRTITFAGGHPGMNEGTPLTAEEMVGVLLDGIRDRTGPGSPETDVPDTTDAAAAAASTPTADTADLETAAC
ncbi:TetR family transcriptional regulator [Nakamurella silvestris]|nr:TetR family transcriptional regulator [Nakamurella silvestris]